MRNQKVASELRGHQSLVVSLQEKVDQGVKVDLDVEEVGVEEDGAEGVEEDSLEERGSLSAIVAVIGRKFLN